jgi:two-component system response regulator PilR (NtrC family)
LVAKAIYQQGPRKQAPFVVVNCGGVPESLIESELFGYKKGAFTGAAQSHKGLVEVAQGGVLFLDEIGELSPALQVKLLRLTQEKTIRMVGDTQDVPVNVRIISATNRDLEKMVIDGSFREDLFYRLNVLRIHIPPCESVVKTFPFSRVFPESVSAKLVKNVQKISSYAKDILMSYNFRECTRTGKHHRTQRGLETSSIVLPESLTLSAHKEAQQNIPLPSANHLLSNGLSLDQYLADVEKEMLSQAMEKAQGVKQKAAKILGISFRSIRYRLSKYGLADDDD